MNVGEYGISFNFNVNFNIASFTSLSLDIVRPDGSTISRANGPVTVGTVALVTTDSGTFAANQYAVYTFAAGDLTQAGTYTARLTYVDASPKRLTSDVISFVVST